MCMFWFAGSPKLAAETPQMMPSSVVHVLAQQGSGARTLSFFGERKLATLVCKFIKL